MYGGKTLFGSQAWPSLSLLAFVSKYLPFVVFMD